MARQPQKRKSETQKGNPLVLGGLLAGAAVLLLAGLYFAFFANSSGGAGPKFTVDRERIDLGPQPVDKMVKATFNITNAGDRDLTLDTSAPVKVVKGC